MRSLLIECLGPAGEVLERMSYPVPSGEGYEAAVDLWAIERATQAKVLRMRIRLTEPGERT